MGFFDNKLNRKYKVAIWSVVGLVIILFIAGLGGGEEEPKESPTPVVQEESEPEVAGTTEENDLTLVTRVIDGDTFEIEGGDKVRIIGVDTPETVHPSKPVECMGKEASEKMKELIDGKRVRLEKDVSDTDRYDRLLRYVYLEDGTFVNELLVREGFASASSYPPDISKQELFREAEQSARDNKWGLWSDICNETTTETTEVNVESDGSSASVKVERNIEATGSVESATSVGVTAGSKTVEEEKSTGTCDVKGNIASDGEKIYHVPGCASYNRTKISPSKGEKYFCSEAEAKAAGWRKALNC